MNRRIIIWINIAGALLAVAIPAVHMTMAKPAPSEHPEYHDAVNDLRNARKHLEKALNDGYGHRDRAMRAIDHAIQECDAAVAAMH